jgi:hypothetical protein
MNVRTQVTLDAELQRRAHAKAAELGISFAEYMRRLVSTDLGEPQRKAHISDLFDLVKDGPATDIARDKDKLIGEAVWKEHLRKTRRKSGRSGRHATDKTKAGR